MGWFSRPADKYVYSPMLARSDIIGQVPDFATALDRTFGTADKYNTLALAEVQSRFSAKPVMPGQALKWIDVSTLSRKIFRQGKAGPLGSLHDNMLSKTPGQKVQAPKDTTIMFGGTDVSDPKFWGCTAKTFLAQCNTRPKDSRQALKDLKSEDELYIVGHCCYRGDYMSYKSAAPLGCGDKNCHREHHDIRQIDPATLAGLLELEGLPKTFKSIYLVGCWTGGLDMDSEQSVQPYAQRLAGALKGWGYNKIVTYGMTGIADGSTLGATQMESIKNEKLVFQMQSKKTPFQNALRRFTG